MQHSSHQWTKSSDLSPPPSKATQPPLSTFSNLPVRTHIPVLSLQPFTLNMPTSAPLSSQR